MNVGKIIGGIVIIAIGTVFIVFAQPLARVMRDLQRAFLGKIGEDAARNLSTRYARVWGIGAILLGGWLVISGLLGD